MKNVQFRNIIKNLRDAAYPVKVPQYHARTFLNFHFVVSHEFLVFCKAHLDLFRVLCLKELNSYITENHDYN